MTELSAFMNAIYRVAVFAIAISLGIWAIAPELRGLAAGLAVGIAASVINAWFLASKVRLVTEQAAQQGKRRVNFGFLTRAAVAVLAVLIAVRTEGISMPAVIVGIFFSPMATLIMGVIFNRKGK